MLRRTPTHIYLVRLTKENDYALIDAGCAERPLVADIMAAVREATKDGKLRLLLREFVTLKHACMHALALACCMPMHATGSFAACRFLDSGVAVHAAQ